MKIDIPSSLLKVASPLSIAILIAWYALMTVFTANRESLLALVDIEITSEQSLGNVLIEQCPASVIANKRRSIIKELGIQPDRYEQQAVTVSFQYHEQDIGDLPEDQLIRHLSQDEQRPWQAHNNNIVGPENNSIHSSGIEYSSLWTTAPTGTLLFQQSTFSLNGNRL